MSEAKDRNTAEIWFKQALDDHETAEILLKAGKYAQSCFFFQQAAEKAVKACWYYYGEAPWGHAISRLIETFPVPEIRYNIHDELIDDAKELDKFYIPTRYPNGLPSDLTPKEAYTKKNAADGKKISEKIIEKIRSLLNF